MTGASLPKEEVGRIIEEEGGGAGAATGGRNVEVSERLKHTHEYLF